MSPYHLLLTVNFYNLTSTSSPTGILSGGCSSTSPNAHCCPWNLPLCFAKSKRNQHLVMHWYDCSLFTNCSCLHLCPNSASSSVADLEGVPWVPWKPSFEGLPSKILCANVLYIAHCCPSVQTITAVPTSFLTTSTIVKSLHVPRTEAPDLQSLGYYLPSKILY